MGPHGRIFIVWMLIPNPVKSVYCQSPYLTSMQSTSWGMLGWMKYKLESRFLEEISITPDMQMTPPLWQKVKNWRASWWKWKRRVKNWLRTQHSNNEDPAMWSHHFMANRWGKKWKQWEALFSWAPKSLQMVTSAMKSRRLILGRKAMTNLDSTLKSRDIALPTKVQLVKAMFFSSSHVWMWELDYKESWVTKNWCSVTVVLEKTLQSPLDCKEIQPVHPKGNQSSIFIGRTDAEAKTPILWPPDVRNWLTGKDPDAEKDWRQEEKGTTENEMVGWHHQLNGHEFE